MPHPEFDVALSCSPDDIRAAQRLRYEVFVEELGGDGDMVDHEAKLERDHFDPHAKHLILRDKARKDAPVVGVYRMLDAAGAAGAGGYYSQSEFDLSTLVKSGLRLLELGRSCLHADYRGGAGMYHLWAALSRYVREQKFDVLFGVASFHGTDAQALAKPLSLLGQRHLAPEPLRVKALAPRSALDLIPEAQLDRKAAVLQLPALIKAYLRLGGFVGEGAYLDHAFNTTDVCLILDVTRMSDRQRALYSKAPAL